MATPDFVAQNDSNFVPIRYYTAADPYFYTVDNRPLQDIEANLKAGRSGGSDAARRAALIGSLNLATIIKDIYAVPSFSNSNGRAMAGLQVSNPSGTVIRISSGAVFEQRQINNSITDVVTKMAMLTKSKDFTLTAPVAASTYIIYTIEASFVEITNTTSAASELPFMDATNNYLPSTLTHGELQLSLNAGVASNSPAVPATTNGKFPLYNIMISNTSELVWVTLHADAPYMRGANEKLVPYVTSLQPATVGVTHNVQTVTYADAATSGAAFSVNSTNLNPYRSMKLKLTFVSSATGGNVVFNLRYVTWPYLTTTFQNTAVDVGDTVVPVTVPANTIITVTLTPSVSASSFGGFVGGVYTVDVEKLVVMVHRMGADASDTNTGSVTLLQAQLVQ